MLERRTTIGTKNWAGAIPALLSLGLCQAPAHAQTYVMGNATWETCAGAMFDSGGAGGNYGNNENFTATLCPTGGAGSGPLSSITFTQWNVAGVLDALEIHDGPTSAAPLIATGSLLNSLAGQTFTATGASGCLTFVWTSDPTLVSAGWRAEIRTGPSAGSNNAITLCNTGAPVNMTSQLLGAPDTGGQWTTPGGANHIPTFDPSTDPPGDWHYTVSGPSPCADSVATLSIAVLAAPNAGSNGSVTVCSLDPPFDLIDELGGMPQVGGTWVGPGGPSTGTYIPGTSTPGVYTYTVTGAPPCSNASAQVTVSQVTAPNPGSSRSIVVCSNDPPFSMFGQLGGTPDPGGSWSGPSPVVGGQFDPGAMSGGAYIYTVVGTPPCVSRSATLTITLRTAPNAGSSNSVDFCSNDASFSLLGQLGGTPDGNGSWTGPGGASNGTFIPGVSLPGDYIYTVVGQSPCVPATATVTVNITIAPDAGTNNTITVCSDEGPFALADSLGGTPDGGGSWTGPGGPHGPNFDPAIDDAGTYAYTVTGQGPCQDATATLQISINQAPDAGTNGLISVCSIDAPFDLIDELGGDPDLTGTWTDPNHDPFPSGSFTPGTSPPGTYTYTVPGVAPCANATSTVEVQVTLAPNAGTNASITVCSDDPNVDLFSLLGGDPDAGGTWSGPGGPHDGIYHPLTEPGGTYTYTVAGQGPCADDQASVQVTRHIAPRAGTDGTITVCSNNGPFNLLTVLGGAPMATGSWTAPGGAAFPSGQFFPGTSTPGTYRYIVTGTGPCDNDTAFATVNVVTAPNAGLNGNFTTCGNGASFALFGHLGGTPDGGGSWSFMGPHPATYMPLTDDPGVYTYTVAGMTPCANASATVFIQEVAPPDPGGNGTLTVCSTEPSTSLFAVLTGSPATGGTWSGPSAVVNGMYDPATMDDGDYSYTVTGTAPCMNASATVTVTENPAPNSGGAGSISVCEGPGQIDLFDLLVGAYDTPGVWSDDDNCGQFMPPAEVDLGGLADGTYHFTYIVAGNGNCPDAGTTVTITVVDQLNAGSNTSRTICGSQTAYNLFSALNGGPDPGGSWLDNDNTNAVTNGIFNASLVAPGTYHFTYHLDGAGGCPDDSANLTVTVVSAPSAGLHGDTLVCSNGVPFGLFSVLNGAPQGGGTWRDQSNSPHTSTYDPLIDSPQTFTYRVNGMPPCAMVTQTVTVNEQPAPNAGQNTAISVCSSDQPFDMTAAMNGAPDIGGTWTDPNSIAHSSIFDPSTDPGGVYLYTVPGLGPCNDAIKALTISKEDRPFAGNDHDTTVCDAGSAFLLEDLLGSHDGDGTWYDPGLVEFNGLFDPGTFPQGQYLYVVESMNGTCDPDTAVINVFVNPAPFAGTPNSIQWCSDGGQVDLLSLLGAADNTGTWTDPEGMPSNGTFDPTPPTPDPEGTYTYLVTGSPPCAADSATVVVDLNQAPNAGCNASIQVCSSDAPFDLFQLLGCTPQSGGNWTGPNNLPTSNLFFPGGATPSQPGTYTYHVDGPPGCDTDSAKVTVSVSQAVDAGGPGVGNATFCDPGAQQNLFLYLTGAPQLGGVWRDPNYGVHSQFFLPGTDQAGDYHYIRIGQGACVNDTATVHVAVNTQPYPGRDTTITVCDSQLQFALFPLLGPGVLSNGTWNPNTFGLYTPGNDTPGPQTYTVPGPPGCSAQSATINIIQNHQPEAGADNSLVICSSDGPVDLETLLNGAEANGEWLDPGAQLTSSIFTPGLSQPGDYSYHLDGDAPCQDDQATITIVENVQADAGIDASILLCTNGPILSLIDTLNGTPDLGGYWTGPNGLVPDGTFDPAEDAQGSYIYHVTGIAPCADDSAFVLIGVVDAPDAGTDGTMTVCLDDAAIQLIDGLEGMPELGGSWTNLDNIGTLVNGVLDATGVPEGTYSFNYSVSGSGPCANAMATLVLTIASALDAGGDASVQVCESEDQVALFPVLDGTPQTGGDWLDVDGSGGLSNATFNATIAGVGVWHFDYIISSSAACQSDTATITVDVLEGPNAGCPGGVNICSNVDPFPMFPLIGCSPDGTGTWKDPDGNPHAADFDPSMDQSGGYVYLVPAIGNCPADSVVVTIQVQQAPFAGDDVPLSVCSNSNTVDMFTLLVGADPGGYWRFSGTNHVSTYNPAIDNPGAYDYHVSGAPYCQEDVATVLVTENPAVHAGGDGAAIVCSSATSLDLFGLLSGSPDQGGQWLDPDLVMHGPAFVPAMDEGGSYTYVVQGQGVCVNDSAIVDIDLTIAPNAGGGVTIDVCSTEMAVDLFAELTNDPDTIGYWVDVDMTQALTDSLFDATIPGEGQFDFLYVVPGSGPCVNDTATVTVNVSNGVDVGIGGEDTICGGITDHDLFNSLGGTPDHGGIWQAINGTVVPFDTSHIDPSALLPGTTIGFTYTITSAACGDVSTQVVLTIADYPDPGMGGTLNVCSDGDPLVLFQELGGTPDQDGAWTGPDGSPHGVTFDPSTDPPGEYDYTVPGVAPCADSTATLLIMVNDPPYAGADSSVVVCNVENAYDLFYAVGGGAPAGGDWSEPQPTGALYDGSLLDATLLMPGTYPFDYAVSVPGCGSASAEVTVNVVDGVQVGDLTATCNEQDRTYVVTFVITGGDPAGYSVDGLAGVLSDVPPYTFISDPLFTGQSYLATVDDDQHCTPQQVNGSTPCEFATDVFVPEAFSPNGDGINEAFTIPGIEGYPNNTITIWNRWGDEVFAGSGYDNRTVVWSGTSTDALLPGDLPAGTYFYILDLGNGKDPIKGYVFLNR
ncbi:MAG: gliding motility-associated C-terminal domain-containing protein [Flavobacteriales bacterium]|nr:gliding motility-associated C-terminal domain-containing protein [Flavobacteriales bacterium]MCB9193279.1 gliding motility-associated C-terminal domain-containing protein [Flavobacteriales bacterium]